MMHMSSDPSNKTNNAKATMKRLAKDLSKHKYVIFTVIFFCIVSAVTYIITPILLKDFINESSERIMAAIVGLNGVVNPFDWGWFFSQMAIMLAFYVASAITGFLSNYLLVFVSGDLAYDFRNRVKDKIDTLPLSYFDRVPYGETLSRATNDVNNISQNVQQIILQVFNNAAILIGAIVAMFITRWELALVAMAELPIFMIIVFLVASKSQQMFVSYRKELGVLNGKIEENYSGYKIIKLFNKEEETISDFNKTNKVMARADSSSQFLSSLIFPTTNFINNIAFVFISVVAGLLQDSGSMIAFFMFLGVFSRPFQQIGQIVNVIQSVLASSERVYDLLDESEEVLDKTDSITDVENVKGNFVFEHVTFSYSPETPLIEDMNLNINAGDTIAIVGPTGAGKTTIVNLLMRFYELNSGSIKLDGIDIRDYSRNALRDTFGMVLQDTWLFNGTIRDNIKYGAQNSSEEEIIKACKEARAMHFINTLPNGLDFVLNEDGSNISQGQKQLLTIARAILSNPKIMILDEATSSVDTRTEKAIQDGLDHIMKNKTSFVIAHRLSTIKNAKCILVMKKGRIIETGTHDELIKANGFYADLYNSQFLGSANSDN